MEIEIWCKPLNKWIRVNKRRADAMAWNFKHWSRKSPPGSTAETIIDLMLSGF